MSARVVQNFRGMRAGILLAPDRNREILIETLARLGLDTSVVDPAADSAASGDPLGRVDILFFDGDAPDGALAACGTFAVPLVAVLGLETPSRLQRALDLAPSALLHKPLRSTGIYTTLFFAINEYRRRQDLADHLADLKARHGARRFVIKAVLALAAQHGIDDDEAYCMLRRESMQQRLTVEELAVRLLATGPFGSAKKGLRA
jgi:AmiR/NasT family two-component response regulator